MYDLARTSLAAHRQQGVSVVLQIEEGHALENAALKSLKRILELSGGFETGLAVILYAQPEILTQKFSVSNLTLREVALRCMMIPLPGIYSQIEKYLGVDSLRYLSLEGMLSMSCLPDTTFCSSCFSGKYPIEIPRINGDRNNKI